MRKELKVNATLALEIEKDLILQKVCENCMTRTSTHLLLIKNRGAVGIFHLCYFCVTQDALTDGLEGSVEVKVYIK